MSDTIFGKILRRELPATVVYEDDQCLAFKDVNPVAPMHVLVIPKTPIPKLSDGQPEHQALLGHLFLTAARVAADQGYGDAFRVVVNNGAKAGQTVFHLHLHVIGGQASPRPPG